MRRARSSRSPAPSRRLRGVAPSAASFLARDLRLLDQALQHAKRRGRLEPIALTIERGPGDPVRVVLTGRQLPGKDESLYLVVNRVDRRVGPALLDAKRGYTETGLLDQQSFTRAAKALIASEDRPDKLSLALVQLQGLQDLRARSGEDTVDALLREIGALLQLNAADGSAAGRLSADKFGVVRSAHCDSTLKPAIERLVQACDPHGETVRVHEHDVQLNTGDLTSADVARALAYTLGRFVSDSEEFSLPTLVDGFRAQVAETVSRISQIKSAVLTKKIDVAFQPIVALDGRAIHHYEMLARFEPGTSPYELINFAEQIGLIEDIDLFICQRGISIPLASLRNDKASFAINISARSLGSDMFVRSLIGLCDQHPALRERLLFEITESTAIKDLTRAGRILTQLREAGHRICLDDFGAGSSSFPYLQALAVDFVKIDGAYVDRMAMSRKDRSIVAAMASMCKELDIATIAEKIEHEEQARMLLDLGVGYGQGYLFGRPTVALTGLAA